MAAIGEPIKFLSSRAPSAEYTPLISNNTEVRQGYLSHVFQLLPEGLTVAVYLEAYTNGIRNTRSHLFLQQRGLQHRRDGSYVSRRLRAHWLYFLSGSTSARASDMLSSLA